MLCNYQNLIHAYKLYAEKINPLNINNAYAQLVRFLAFNQIIGFIQLVELPIYERFLFARSGFEKALQGECIERSLEFIHYDGKFCHYSSALIDSRSGMGFNAYASMRGALLGQQRQFPDSRGFQGTILEALEGLLKIKTLKLQKLCSPASSILCNPASSKQFKP